MVLGIKKVYVASPVRPLFETLKRMGQEEDEAMRIVRGVARNGCLDIKNMGFVPVSPILAFDGIYSEYEERESIDDACEALLLGCDFIYVIQTPYNKDSKGIAQELEIAKANNIPIIDVQNENK